MDEYRRLFLSESREHLESLDRLLVDIGHGDTSAAAVREAFRIVHTLKGMAATMGYSRTVEVSHQMEDILDSVRKGKAQAGPGEVDGMEESVDSLKEILEHIEATGEEGGRKADLGLRNTAGGERAGVIRTVRVSSEKLDTLLNLVGELVIARNRLGGVGALWGTDELHALERLVGTLQEHILRMRMVPVENILRPFPRMVRDLARDEGKEVGLSIDGGELEADRAVLEVAGGALVHLLRNAVHHGIEPPEERKRTGKPPAGSLRITIEKTQSHLHLSVSDDGRGIDSGALRAAAVERGMVAPDKAAAMDDGNVLGLIGTSGLSTSAGADRVAGRGVGMDAVRKSVESIGGSVRFSSGPGAGTTVTLRLPLTVLIVPALLIRTGSETYALPLVSVAEIVDGATAQRASLRGEEVLTLRDRVVPVVELGALFGASGTASRTGRMLVVVGAGEVSAALGVDGVIGQQHIVVKEFDPMLKRAKWFGGATILNDGTVCPVIDPAKVLVVR